MPNLSLSEILGAPVIDSTGAVRGRVREVAVFPQDDPSRIAAFIVRTRNGDRMLPPAQISSIKDAVIRSSEAAEHWTPLASSEGFLLLERDLLDQQIIDVHGRKVVRVNDVDFEVVQSNGHPTFSIYEVEIGPRGAVRRLLKNLAPRRAINAMAERFSPKIIPWDFVDLIEVDPARRVKLKIEHARLSRLHPADIADILEELAPAQREAVFETLDEDVAADALEELDPKLQGSLLESLDSDHAADIVEEMEPDAAADLLENLSDQASEQILDEMQPEEREEVEELLEFEEDTAAGRMTTAYISAPQKATAEDAINLLRGFEGGVETVSTIFLVDEAGNLVGAVPLAKLALADNSTPLATLTSDQLISCSIEANEKEVAELFDKYNLLTLPVIDETGQLNGVITADDIISLLRRKL
ncbi:MAG: Mg/Co/Ni transporter MgtE [Candidatus Angelobacter sp.]|jgi:magnesium transporter|nr:Mg/Co/Ni transporter MgtE [Candidatus Angelobacter sp.]